MTKKARTKRRLLSSLTEAEKLEAAIVASEKLAEVWPEHQIRAHLCERYKCTPATAAALLQRAWKQVQEQFAVQEAPTYRAMMNARLDALYRKAWAASDLGTCNQILKQQAKLWGLDQPMRVQHSVVESFTDGRTLEDCEFYAEHGCWPEEAPDHMSTEPDPLSRLPH